MAEEGKNWVDEYLLDPLIGDVEEDAKRYAEEVADSFKSSGFGQFLDSIKQFMNEWAGYIGDFLGQAFEKLGDWIGGFISEVPSDTVLNNFESDVPQLDSLKAKGYNQDYSQAITKAKTEANKGWNRVLEYTGTKISGAGDYIFGSDGNATNDAEEKALKQVAMRTAEQTYDEARKLALKDIGFTDNELKDQTIKIGDHEISYNFLEDNHFAGTAADQHAAELAGVNFAANDHSIITKDGKAVGAYGQVIRGGQADEFILRITQNADSRFAAAKEQLTESRSRFEQHKTYAQRLNSMPDELLNALEQKEVENLLDAMTRKDPDTGEPLLSNQEFDALIKSNLTGLITQLTDKDTEALSKEKLNIIHDAANNEWQFIGQNADETEHTVLNLTLPPIAGTEQGQATAPAR